MSLLKSVLAYTLTRKALRQRWEFHLATQRPRETQHEVLRRLVAQHADSAFGRDHHFSEIHTLDDFRRNLPVSRYEDFAPYIERVKNGEIDAMFSGEKVLMFALTSGTSSARKFIPVTKTSVDDYRRLWTIWGLQAFEQHQGLLGQAKLAFVGDDEEFRTAAGIPCGSISGLTTKMQNALVRHSYVLPAASGKLKDVSSKYYLAWRLGAQRSVGMLVTPNPSTLVNLGRYLSQNAEDIIRDIHDGDISGKFDFSHRLMNVVRRQLRPNRKRAAELDAAVRQHGTLLPRHVWPSLRLIGCWTGGSVGTYLRFFPEMFGDAAVRDIGLIASESRMTVTKEDNTPGGILELTSTFYEFIPVEDIDSTRPTILEAHELEEGRDYYILLTTSTGLYRYNIHDVVRVTGFHEKTPILTFLNKGSHISNLTGEKISEYQVATAVDAGLKTLNLKLDTFSLAPCWDDEQPYYGLFVERSAFPHPGVADELTRLVDVELRRLNCEYDGKRQSERLGEVQAVFLSDDAWRKWDQARLANAGGTAEQYKHPCLIVDVDFHKTVARPTAGQPASTLR